MKTAATIADLISAGYDAIACTNDRVAIYDNNTQDYHLVDWHAATKLAEGVDYSTWCADTSSEAALDLIPALRCAAAEAGDDGMVALCDRALKGDFDTYRTCVEAL